MAHVAGIAGALLYHAVASCIVRILRLHMGCMEHGLAVLPYPKFLCTLVPAGGPKTTEDHGLASLPAPWAEGY